MKKVTTAAAMVVVAGVLMTPFAPPAFAAADDSLVARYTFDDAADRGADSSGKGNDLTTFGSPAFGTPTGSASAALQLSGANGQYARIPDQVFSSVGNDFTLEFAASSASSGNGFFTVGIGKDDNRYLLIKVDENGGGRVAIATDGWRNEQGFSFSATPGTHTYRVVVEPGLIAMFVDGKLAGYNADVTFTVADLQGSTAYLGRSFYGGDRYFKGDFDNISVWDDVETPASLTSLSVGGDKVVDGSATMGVGRSTSLAAVAEPEGSPNAVRWSISDSTVASIDRDGTVVANRLGTATVTATSVFDPSITATATINVVDGGEAALAEDLRAAIAAVSPTTTENLPLVVTGTEFGSDISWTSSDASVVTGTGPAPTTTGPALPDPYQGGGIVTRAAYGDGDRTATLTATATRNGVTVTSQPIQITVKENTRTAPDTAYAAVNMRNENTTYAQSVWLSSTDGADFFSFKTRNGGNPAIQGDSDTYGLRDHYIQKSVGGDKYYLMSTDLDSVSQNWGYFGSRGSLKLEVYESTDLVHWTRTNGDGDGGITVSAPTAGMTWAPESFWDESLQSYVVFFSSTEFTDSSRNTPVAGRNGGGYTQVFAALTRDFKTFTYPPFHWQNTGYARIDSHVFQIGDYYYRLTKNEEGGSGGAYLPQGKMTFLERSKVLTSTTTETSPANDPNRTWQLLDESLLPFEGPASVKLLPNDPANNAAKDGMVILSDGPDAQFGGEQRYLPYMTSETQIAQSSWTNRLSQTPGWTTVKQPGPGVTGRVNSTGMPEITRHGAFFTIPEAISTALKNWDDVQAVGSTTAATYDSASRVISATVTAADTGTLAGNVVFTLSDSTARAAWSQSVKVIDGKASVTVPDDVTGSVSVAYDGYAADDLVAPSETTVTGITAVAGPTPTPTPEPTQTPQPTATPTTQPTVAPTATPTPTSTVSPTSTPAPTASVTATPSASAAPAGGSSSNTGSGSTSSAAKLAKTGQDQSILTGASALALMSILGGAVALVARRRRRSAD